MDVVEKLCPSGTDVKSESQQCSLSQLSWASLLAPPSIVHSVTLTRVVMSQHSCLPQPDLEIHENS